jgi:hypothetical protein
MAERGEDNLKHLDAFNKMVTEAGVDTFEELEIWMKDNADKVTKGAQSYFNALKDANKTGTLNTTTLNELATNGI